MFRKLLAIILFIVLSASSSLSHNEYFNHRIKRIEVPPYSINDAIKWNLGTSSSIPIYINIIISNIPTNLDPVETKLAIRRALTTWEKALQNCGLEFTEPDTPPVCTIGFSDREKHFEDRETGEQGSDYIAGTTNQAVNSNSERKK